MNTGVDILQQVIPEPLCTTAGAWLSEALQPATTPAYHYHQGLISQQTQQLLTQLPAGIDVHYAIKANPHPQVLQTLAPLVAGFDCASLAEMQAARAVAQPEQHLSIAGPAKSDEELAYAINHQVVINCESRGELERIIQLAKTVNRIASVALRVNPPFGFKGAGMQMGGGPKPFGIDSEQIPTLIQQYRDHPQLHLTGFHLFAGSQQLNPDLIAQVWQASLDLVAEWQRTLNFNPEKIVLGAGLGVAYHPKEQPLDLSALTPAFKAIREWQAAHNQPRIALESGRYLLASAGVYRTRIVDIKQSRGQRFVLCDGGMHQHLALSGNLGGVLRRNWPIVVPELFNQPHDTPMQVHGPLCTPLDVLGKDQPLPAGLEPGMHLVVLQSGAYGATASPQQFLSRPALQEFIHHR